MEWKIKMHRRALAFLNELPIKRRKLVGTNVFNIAS